MIKLPVFAVPDLDFNGFGKNPSLFLELSANDLKLLLLSAFILF